MTESASKARDRGLRLVRWYDRNRRDLPWRESRSPWSVWVSEVMLQQTTVKTVLPRYAAFLERFPDPAALAAADEASLLEAVAGLGYYRRFKALRTAAIRVTHELGGRIPDDPEGLRQLPGVGDYMAGAILSIAFGRPAAAVDGNVVRVLARLEADPGLVDDAAARRRLKPQVEAMMPPGKSSELTQALFDLGATVCLPRLPRCETCPLREGCRGFAAGEPGAFPRPKARREPETWVVAAAWIEGKAGIFVRRRPAEASRMPGFFELPEVWLRPEEDAMRALVDELHGRHGIRAEVGELLAESRHAITHHRLRCRLYRVRPATGLAAPRDGEFVADVDSLASLSTISKKLVRAQRSRSAE